MKPLLISSGEPSGIGPDICLALANIDVPMVIIADKNLLLERAHTLRIKIQLIDYTPNQHYKYHPNTLTVLHLPCKQPAIAGKLHVANVAYVLTMLDLAATYCLNHEFSGLVTAPVNKGLINTAGFPFQGHTEFLANKCGSKLAVMLLACHTMKVALATTHLALCQVPQAITQTLIVQILRQLHWSLQHEFAISNPRIGVAGLNPHAGDNGALGSEEITIITPAIQLAQQEEINVVGPMAADTLFTQNNLNKFDVFLAMYHDQGLPVLKYAGFGHAVNLTLGLPIIRTSVDHGTAIELAGSSKASPQSLIEAVHMAWYLAKMRHTFS